MATAIRRSVDWVRLAQIISSISISIFVGYRFQPMVAGNENAVNTVVTIFSILAGFLIAVITFIAEPTIRQARSWSELQLMKGTIERKLLRQKILFFLYLLTLGVAMAMFLTPPSFVEELKWIQGIFLGLASFVFLASFSLPGSLMRMQMERYEAELDDRKPEVLRKKL